MVRDALVETFDIFRPVKPSSPTGKVAYEKAVLSNVKLSCPSTGFTVSSSGETRRQAAVLFFNEGWSVETPFMAPPLQAGDMVSESSNFSEPPAERLVVQSVSKHTFKGALSHWEAMLA